MNEPLSIQQNVHRMGVRMDCVFEGTAYNPERETVREMRLAGKECSEISCQTGMPMEQVVQFCHELGLPETGSCHLMPPGGPSSRVCPVCGRVVCQTHGGGKKRFCSEECRKTYETKNYKKLKSSRIAVCQNCGREFAAYCESGGKRKFCSRNCYYESRYGLKEGR